MVVNSRGGKSICHTCTWQYCAHLKKYRDNENNEALEDESDDEEKLPQRKLPRQKKQTSSLIPDGKKGADANIFGIIIEHPPTEAEKILINKINKEDPFLKKLMIPALDKIFSDKNFCLKVQKAVEETQMEICGNGTVLRTKVLKSTCKSMEMKTKQSKRMMAHLFRSIQSCGEILPLCRYRNISQIF